MTQPTRKEKTDVLLKGDFSLSPEDYAPIKEKVFREMCEGVSLPGFRPGKAPEHLVREKISLGALMEETARRAIEEIYPTFLKSEAAHPIGAPRISITKIAEGNPLEFSIEVPLYPPFTLPDYKTIAADIWGEKIEEPKVSKEEIQNALLDIKKYREDNTPKGEGNEEKDTKEIPLDDAFAQSLGNFKTLDDLKEKMKENLLSEKEQKAKSDRRKKIITRIIEKANIPLPEMLVDTETNGMYAELQENTKAYGLAFEDYLRHSKKTEEELRQELRVEAEKRIREELIVHEIAEKESLHPEVKEIEEQTEAFLTARPDADADSARRYVSELLLHEKVYNLLEQSK